MRKHHPEEPHSEEQVVKEAEAKHAPPAQPAVQAAPKQEAKVALAEGPLIGGGGGGPLIGGGGGGGGGRP